MTIFGYWKMKKSAEEMLFEPDVKDILEFNIESFAEHSIDVEMQQVQSNKRNWYKTWCFINNARTHIVIGGIRAARNGMPLSNSDALAVKKAIHVMEMELNTRWKIMYDVDHPARNFHINCSSKVDSLKTLTCIVSLEKKKRYMI